MLIFLTYFITSVFIGARRKPQLADAKHGLTPTLQNLAPSKLRPRAYRRPKCRCE